MKAMSLGLVFYALFPLFSAKAQTTISNPVTIQLVPIQLSYYYKYGIYASAGGSTDPQLYEFDTGGSGFYPVFGAGATGWGTNYISSGTTFTNTYDSGNVYTGNSVTASVSIFSSEMTGPMTYTNSAAPSITTATNILVGQTTGITNTNGKPNNWPNSNAPVEGSFYGDFGLSLKSSSNGIMNVLAQLQYTNGVIPGFVVRLGSMGNTNASIQVGLHADYATNSPFGLR